MYCMDEHRLGYNHITEMCYSHTEAEEVY